MHGASGYVATRDLCGKGFDPEHPSSLLQLAGSALTCILVLTEIKGDWPAWNLISGFYPYPRLEFQLYFIMVEFEI